MELNIEVDERARECEDAPQLIRPLADQGEVELALELARTCR